jgi:hypothetical protein
MTDNFFGGAPNLSWARKTPDGGYVDIPELRGVIRGGVITHIQGAQQATDIMTGKPAWWEAPTATTPGRPKMQYVITLRCDGSRGGARDERTQTPGVVDNGDRRLFIPDGDMRKAVGTAFRNNGQQDLKVGDELYVAHTGYRPNKLGAGKPAKTWAAKHVVGLAPEQQWGEDPSSVAAAGPDPAAGQANPFGGQQPAQGPQVVHGNGPQQGQPVPVGQGPGAAPQPAANPFGGPLPVPEQTSQVANPFA